MRLYWGGRHAVGQGETVGEKQEVTIGMPLEKLKEILMQERFASENSKEIRTLFLTLADHRVQRADIKFARRFGLTYPAAPAGKVAAVGD